jgi:hypothetical protein
MGINVASSFTRNAPVPIDDSFIVADLTARDAIASGVRYEGMFCYVEAEGVNYQLIGGIDNANWEEFGSGGGGGSGNLSDYTTDNFPSPNDAFKSNIPVKIFSFEEEQSIFFTVQLNGYKPGKRIALSGLMAYSESANADAIAFLAETKLFRVGSPTTLATPHVSGNANVFNDPGNFVGLGDIDLTDLVGEIDGDPVQDGDSLLIRIYRYNGVSSNLEDDVGLVIRSLQLNLDAT